MGIDGMFSLTILVGHTIEHQSMLSIDRDLGQHGGKDLVDIRKEIGEIEI
jgi:hypothetical protein